MGLLKVLVVWPASSQDTKTFWFSSNEAVLSVEQLYPKQERGRRGIAVAMKTPER